MISTIIAGTGADLSAEQLPTLAVRSTTLLAILVTVSLIATGCTRTSHDAIRTLSRQGVRFKWGGAGAILLWAKNGKLLRVGAREMGFPIQTMSEHGVHVFDYAEVDYGRPRRSYGSPSATTGRRNSGSSRSSGSSR